MNVNLVGTWSLQAYEMTSGVGTVTRPFGDAPLGRIMYGADGSMSAMLGASDRAPFDGRGGAASDAQWAELARRFTAYAGTWTREGDVVRHRVEIALHPDWIGTTLERTIGQWEGGITLNVEPRSAGGRAHRLVWARVNGAS